MRKINLILIVAVIAVFTMFLNSCKDRGHNIL